MNWKNRQLFSNREQGIMSGLDPIPMMGGGSVPYPGMQNGGPVMDHTHPELHSHSAPPSGLTPLPEYLPDFPSKPVPKYLPNFPEDIVLFDAPGMQTGGLFEKEPSIEEQVAKLAELKGISVPTARGQLLEATARRQGMSLPPDVINQFAVGLISLHDALAQGTQNQEVQQNERNLAQQEQLFFPGMQTGGIFGMDLFEEGDQDVNEALNMMATVANPEVPDMPATNGAAPMMQETVEVTETITEDQRPNDFKSAVKNLKDTYKTEIRNYISEAGMEGIDRYLKRMDVSYNNELNNLRKQFKVEILDPEDMLLTEEFIAELMGASIPGMDDGGVVMTQEKLDELFGKNRFLLSDWEKLDPSLQEVWLNKAQIAKIEQDMSTSSSIDMTALNNLLQERRDLSKDIGEAARSGYASIGSTGGHFLGARSAGRQAELSARDAALADEIGLQKALLTAQAGGKGVGGLDFDLSAAESEAITLRDINRIREENERLGKQWDAAIKAKDGKFAEAFMIFYGQTGGKIPIEYQGQIRAIPDTGMKGDLGAYYQSLLKKDPPLGKSELKKALEKWNTFTIVSE